MKVEEIVLSAIKEVEAMDQTKEVVGKLENVLSIGLRKKTEIHSFCAEIYLVSQIFKGNGYLQVLKDSFQKLKVQYSIPYLSKCKVIGHCLKMKPKYASLLNISFRDMYAVSRIILSLEDVSLEEASRMVKDKMVKKPSNPKKIDLEKMSNEQLKALKEEITKILDKRDFSQCENSNLKSRGSFEVQQQAVA